LRRASKERRDTSPPTRFIRVASFSMASIMAAGSSANVRLNVWMPARMSASVGAVWEQGEEVGTVAQAVRD